MATVIIGIIAGIIFGLIWVLRSGLKKGFITYLAVGLLMGGLTCILSVFIGFCLPIETKDDEFPYILVDVKEELYCTGYNNIHKRYVVSYVECIDTVSITLFESELEFSDDMPEGLIYIVKQTPMKTDWNNFALNPIHLRDVKYKVKKQ